MVRLNGQIAIFGEVLFDRFEDGSEVLGGAPFNVAWNLAALGADPLLLSRVGDDSLGDRVRSTMKRWGLSTAGLQTDPQHLTGTVEVKLEGTEPSFEIVADRAYDHIAWEELPRGELSLLYLGSLCLRQPTSRTTAYRLITEHQSKIFVDVNLRPLCWERDRVDRLVQVADRIKLNREELSQLVDGHNREEAQARELLSRSRAVQVCVTRGADGAALYLAAGARYEVSAGHPTEVVDAVGAGDAFASILLLGQLESWSVTDTLARANEFAAAVVGIRGATTEDRLFYERFRQAWSLK